MTAPLGNESIALQAVTGLVDQSGNGFDGTYVGDTAVVADTGAGGTEAYEFDGTGDWISVGDVITPANKLSAACWVKLDTVGVSQFLMSQWGGTGQQCWYIASLAASGAEGTVRLALSQSGSNIFILDSNVFRFAVDTWYHVAFVYDGEAGTAKLYVNGDEIAATINTSVGAWLTSVPSTIHNSTAATLFGARATSSTGSIDGRADDFRIWTVAITAPDIVTISAGRGDNKVSISLVSGTVRSGSAIEFSGVVDSVSADTVQIFVQYSPFIPAEVQALDTESDFEVPGGFTNTGLATDGINFWYTDWTNGNIVKMTPAGVLIESLNIATGTERLQGIVYDPRDSGSIWYCRFNDNQVRRIELDGTEISGSTFSVTQANGIGFHTVSNMLYVLRGNAHTSVFRHNTSGTLLETITISRPASIYNIDHIWIDSVRDHMWISWSNATTSLADRVTVQSLDGTLLATLNNQEINIEGIVVDAAGKMWTCHDKLFHSSVPNGNRIYVTDVRDVQRRLDNGSTTVLDWTDIDTSFVDAWSGSVVFSGNGIARAKARLLDASDDVVAESNFTANFTILPAVSRRLSGKTVSPVTRGVASRVTSKVTG